jgi:hypothetical protein
MNRVDGLYIFGYEGQTLTTPAKSVSGPLQFSRFNTSGVEDLVSILLGRPVLRRHSRPVAGPTFYETPQKVLQYPPEVGVQWSYMTPRDNDGGFVIDKAYTDFVEVTVPAGIFECYEVRWLHDINRDGTVDENVDIRDYISEQGLIKRTLVARGVTVSTYDRIYAAVADLNTVWELESVSVAEK